MFERKSQERKSQDPILGKVDRLGDSLRNKKHEETGNNDLPAR